MKFTRFEDCEVWQMGRELVREIYSLTKEGAFAKDFGLKDQVQRAAVSVIQMLPKDMRGEAIRNS